MKTIKGLTKTVQFFLIVGITCFHLVYAQDSTKNNEATKSSPAKNMMDSKNFVFVAQIASPVGGRTMHLTSYYDLNVSKDTIVSSLPYFGRAYTAPINPSEGE